MKDIADRCRFARDHPSDLVVFPELLVPGYPHGLSFGFVLGARKPEGRLDWKRYYDVVYRGGSCIVDPYGHYAAGPLWDGPGILYADLDMQQVPASKWEFDAVGHYARPDVLGLSVAQG